MPSTKRPRDMDDGSPSPNKYARTVPVPIPQHSQHGQQQPQQQPHAALLQQLKIPVTDYGNGNGHGNGNTNGNGTGIGNGNGNGNGDYGSSNGTGNAAKKKGGHASTRTGQACDRCKTRKIRCDARPGGCSPCLQNNSECKTTDRITGRATSRGHTEVVESENESLKLYLAELQQQLKDHGIEPKPPQGTQQGYTPAISAHTPSQWRQPPPPAQKWEAPATERPTLLPEFRTGCIGDNYLGVSSETSWLSPIEGTSLALFGTKIDLAEFMPAESASVTSAMSYRTFISYAFGRTKPFVPTMPSYEQCIVYAEWYFRTVQAFCPILHKPHFMELLDRIHHQNYQPSSAEAVMVQMVLAIIMFQFSARNHNEQARQDSMAHYQYALSFVPDLITGHKLEDIQALVLICAQLRNQPRPAAAWMFTNFVLGLAIESGLHRSAKAWQGTGTGIPVAHHMEMRKRTFWTLLLYHIALSGKLGRPMPFQLDDFDIEMPELVPDTAPADTLPGSTAKLQECSFSAAIQGFKLCRISMMIYSTIYAVKSNGQYEASVRKLDKELEDFQAQLPARYRGGPMTKNEDRVNYLYIEMAIAESHLLIHHPSLAPKSADPQLMQSNLDVCLNWSGRLLAAATMLKELKSLDTTWYSTTNFLAAIFTTLFIFTERRDQITSAELQKLRQDMDAWMEVIREISMLLGTLPQLQVAVRQIIDTSIEDIARHLAARTASAAVKAALSSAAVSAALASVTEQQPQQQSFSNGFNNSYANEGGTDAQRQGYTQTTPGYPSNPSYTYTEYPSDSHFDPTAYTSDHGENKPNMEVQLTTHNVQASHAGQSDFMAAFASPHLQVGNGFTSPPVSTAINGSAGMFQNAGPAAWRYFADNVVMNCHPEPSHDYSATMMTLAENNRVNEMSGTGMENIAATLGTMMHVPREYEHHAQVWPLIQFSGGMGQ